MKKNKKNEVSNFKKLNRRELIIGASSIGAISLAPKKLLSEEANPENLPPTFRSGHNTLEMELM